MVWALDAMFPAPFGEQLRFKGGTSLSKVYRAIARLSEDLDITYGIRALVPEFAGTANEPLPATRSQVKKWSERVRNQLPKWVADTALPQIQAHIRVTKAPADAWVEGDRLYLSYERVTSATAEYVRPEAMIEFGARSTGEPAQEFDVRCDAAEHLPPAP